jgi:micrococcal nuclease
VGITDRDSISVMHSDKAEKIRLNGIDCPQRGQPFATRAKEFTSSLAFGKEVTLKLKDKDRYGRTAADVILPDRKSLNHELVKAGYAGWYRKDAPHDRELNWLEKFARGDRHGLWSGPHAIAP